MLYVHRIHIQYIIALFKDNVKIDRFIKMEKMVLELLVEPKSAGALSLWQSHYFFPTINVFLTCSIEKLHTKKSICF